MYMAIEPLSYFARHIPNNTHLQSRLTLSAQVIFSFKIMLRVSNKKRATLKEVLKAEKIWT